MWNNGFSIIGFIVPIIIGLASIGVIITIIIIAIKGVKGHGGKIENGETNENKKETAEEINQKIKNIFSNLAGNNVAEQPKAQPEPKSEVKDRRCKNCGASLAEDKNGKLHCPYCQSKYF